MINKFIHSMGTFLFLSFTLASLMYRPTLLNTVEAYDFSTNVQHQNLDIYNRFQTPSLSYYNMLVQGIPTKFVNMENFFDAFTTNNQQTSSLDDYHYSTNEGLPNITQSSLEKDYVYEGNGDKIRFEPPNIYFYSLGQNNPKKAYAYEDEIDDLNANLKKHLNEVYFTPGLHRSVFTNTSNLPINEDLYYSYADQFDLSQYQNFYFKLERYKDGLLELIVQKQISLSEKSLLDLDTVAEDLENFFNQTYRITIAQTEGGLAFSENYYDIYLIEPDKTRNFFTYFNQKNNEFDDTQEIDDEATIYFHNATGKVVANTIIPNVIWTIDNGVTFNELSQRSKEITPENGERNYRIAYFNPVDFSIGYFRFTSKSTLIPIADLSDNIIITVKESERICELKIGDFSFLNQYAFVVNSLQIRYSTQTFPMEQILNVDDSQGERRTINPSQLSYTFSREGNYKILISYNGSPVQEFTKTCSFPYLRAEFKENQIIDVTTKFNSSGNLNTYRNMYRITFSNGATYNYTAIVSNTGIGVKVPEKNINGNWFVGDSDTGVKAEGESSATVVSNRWIGTDSNYFVTNQNITFSHTYAENRMLTSISEQRMKENDQFEYELEQDGNQNLLVALSIQRTHVINTANSQNSIKKYTIRLQDSQNSSSFREWFFIMDMSKPRLQYSVVDSYLLETKNGTNSGIFELEKLEFITSEGEGKTTRINSNQLNETNIIDLKHEPIYILFCHPNEYKDLKIQNRFFSTLESVIGKQHVLPPFLINEANVQGVTTNKAILIDQKLKYTPCSEETPYYIIDFSNESGQKTIEIELIDLGNNISKFRLQKQVKFLSTSNLFNQIAVIGLIFLFFIILTSFIYFFTVFLFPTMNNLIDKFYQKNSH